MKNQAAPALEVPCRRRLLIAIGTLSILFTACGEKRPTVVFDIGSRFSASGWMGDGTEGSTYIQYSEQDSSDPHSVPYAIRIQYRIGTARWAGMYWLNKPDNWGDSPGVDLKNSGLKRITFWARGRVGGEIVEFKAGGIDAPGKRYSDSFEAGTGKKVLSKEWQKFTIDLTGKDLSSVIGGFAWIANDWGNATGLTFFLDDIQFEG